MGIGIRIREKRKATGLTQREVGDYFHISSVSVSEWEREISRPEQDKLPALARLLKTTVNHLLEGSPDDLAVRESAADYNVEPAVTKGKLPLISYIQAGNWGEIVDSLAPGDAEEWIPCPFTHGPNAFVLRVSGFSMYNPGGEKSYAPGEYIAVDPRAEPQNRKMVIAKVDGEEVATFKQLIIDPSGEMMLQALNPSHTPRVMPMPEGSRIIGVVIGKWVPE